MPETQDLKRQYVLYFIFAIWMIALNYGIQKLNQLVFAPAICNSFGSNEFIYLFYCSTSRYDIPTLIGSIVAVGITYFIKFFLDKLIVFKSKGIPLRNTTKEFLKYFIFAILTTIENVGIQFLLRNFLNFSLELSIVLALTIGYSTKFFLDRKYVFRNISKTASMNPLNRNPNKEGSNNFLT